VIWARTQRQEERRIREFLLNESCCSETAFSLAAKLGLNPKRCQRALDQMVDEGVVRRRDLGDIEPIYYRYGER
jgi:predicted ArsR family transcriptional regulator